MARHDIARDAVAVYEIEERYQDGERQRCALIPGASEWVKVAEGTETPVSYFFPYEHAAELYNQLKKIFEPEWPSLPARPIPIARTYPPMSGDPMVLLTSMEDISEYLLTRVAGLDIKNPQEAGTPSRYVRALRDMTTREKFNFTTFEVAGADEMIIEKGIPFASLCRHHILPFTGTAHIGYIPDGTVAGLSKLPRTVNYFSRGLQTQEELTTEIADFLVDKLKPLGVAVFMEAEHSCMTLRGVRAAGVTTSTQAVRGVFADHSRTAKAEFLSRINGR